MKPDDDARRREELLRAGRPSDEPRRRRRGARAVWIARRGAAAVSLPGGLQPMSRHTGGQRPWSLTAARVPSINIVARPQSSRCPL